MSRTDFPLVELPGSGPLAPAPPGCSGRPRSAIPSDALCILLVWLASLILTFGIEPNYDNSSNVELLYAATFNVAVGAFVGFRLFDRVPLEGLALFALRAASAILAGMLFNELLVEPYLFRTGPINAEGAYWGVVDAATTAGYFLLLRLAGRLRSFQRDGATARAGAGDGPVDGGEARRAEVSCFFVRVAGETRRIFVADLIYMEAEKDFTRIVCSNGEHFVSESLKNLVEKAAGYGVVRIHKSFAVSLRRVERLSRNEVRLGERRLPVGRTYRDAVAEAWQARSPALDPREAPQLLESPQPS